MKRVLHVLGGLSLGGAESRIMDIYRKTDRDKLQFDFLVHQNGITGRNQGVREPEFYDEEIHALGGRVFVLPKFKLYNYFTYRRAVKHFFASHHDFSVVQGHMTSTAAIYLPLAGKAGVPITVAHARSAGVDKGMKGKITRWLRRSLLKKADYCFACSKEAGIAVFGQEWQDSGKDFLFPNAIDAEKFIFNPEKRRELRKALGIENCYVIGHVGRFHYAKNHEFLAAIFSCLHEKMKRQGRRAVLLLLGEGSGMEAVKEQVEMLGLTKDVLFMGNKKNVEDYYQVMDYFVFPSRFEGLPGTVVEAQAAGLRCILSDTITPEVGISSLVHFESIGKSPAIWADYIMAHESYQREDMHATITEAGFDVKKQAVRLEEFYRTGRL